MQNFYLSPKTAVKPSKVRRIYILRRLHALGIAMGGSYMGFFSWIVYDKLSTFESCALSSLQPPLFFLGDKRPVRIVATT